MDQRTNGSNAELKSLIDRTNGGDTEARNALLTYVSNELLGRIRKKLGPRKGSKDRLRRYEDSGDVLNEVLFRLHQAFEEVKPESVEHFWVVAANHIRWAMLDLAKRHLGPHRHGTHHHSDGKPADEEGGVIHARPARQNDLDAVIDLDAKMQMLPMEEQVIVTLKVFVGMTWEEVADKLGFSVSTVQRRWLSIKEKLGEALEHDRPK